MPTKPPTELPSSDSTAEKVVRAAAQLLTSEGMDALSTRAVAAAAGVPTPTIFRLFGDKQGLLEAVGWLGVRTYLLQKVELLAIDDPVEVLRRAWDLHIEFGLSQPAFYRLVFDYSRPGAPSQAGEAAIEGLREMVANVARAGRLRMSVERATQYIYANGVGTVLTLLSMPQGQRDLQLATVTRDAILSTIITGKSRGGAQAAANLPSHAATLRELLQREAPSVLTGAERALLDEWLKRLTDAA